MKNQYFVKFSLSGKTMNNQYALSIEAEPDSHHINSFHNILREVVQEAKKCFCLELTTDDIVIHVLTRIN